MNLYAYCANRPVGWTDPYGLKLRGFEELPRNTTGDPIAVSIAFYNGSDPGKAEENDDGTFTAIEASGSQFKESADDFTVPFKGDTYKLYFDMANIQNLDELTEFISARVAGLDFYGYNVTDIYFFVQASILERPCTLQPQK